MIPKNQKESVSLYFSVELLSFFLVGQLCFVQNQRRDLRKFEIPKTSVVNCDGPFVWVAVLN